MQLFVGLHSWNQMKKKILDYRVTENIIKGRPQLTGTFLLCRDSGFHFMETFTYQLEKLLTGSFGYQTRTPRSICIRKEEANGAIRILMTN